MNNFLIIIDINQRNHFIGILEMEEIFFWKEKDFFYFLESFVYQESKPWKISSFNICSLKTVEGSNVILCPPGTRKSHTTAHSLQRINSHKHSNSNSGRTKHVSTSTKESKSFKSNPGKSPAVVPRNHHSHDSHYFVDY